jgi:ADP-ribose pyrophosphatase
MSENPNPQPRRIEGAMELHTWDVLRVRDALKDPWIHVQAETVRTPSGAVLESFYTLHPKDWVMVLARTVDREWILVEQYRHGCREICLEFSAGVIDGKEEAFAAAQRELLEETGYGGGNWSKLYEAWTNPAHSQQKYHVFVALDVQRLSEVDWDLSEELRISFWDEADVALLVEKHLIQNPKHQHAWLRYKLYGNQCSADQSIK